MTDFNSDPISIRKKKGVATLSCRVFWTDWDSIFWVQKSLLLKVFHFGQNTICIRARMTFYRGCQSTPYGVRGRHDPDSASGSG